MGSVLEWGGLEVWWVVGEGHAGGREGKVLVLVLGIVPVHSGSET